jgi:Zn-dependent protease with chaperone function
MNFFESQDRLRTHTALLVVLFVLAVITLIVMTNLLVMLVFSFMDSQQMRDGGILIWRMDWQTFGAASAGVGIVVLAGSLYKILALSGGGRVVAESLGGQLIPQDTQDPNQRKLLNVVQEMAIASGTPAPPVYLLANELGINAFAAGLSPRDAIIGVTQGAIDHLRRDELQGVIAHEFSHIFNGDMRLNLRLIGVLNGILILGILGYYLLYSASFSRGRRSNSQVAAAMLALAIGLIVIGFAGTFFGGLIKAAVSRQREFLADASAVQFTRNPTGIAGALKRIGGLKSGSKVENPGAPEVSHAFFAQGVSGFMRGLSATHPPLAERILRIDPQWDGKFNSSDRADADRDERQASESDIKVGRPVAGKVAAVAGGAAIAQVMTALDQIGSPRPETIDHARSLLSALSAPIKDAAREPHGARAVIYSLVLDKTQEVRARQLKQLLDHADAGVHELTLRLMPEMDQLDVKYRLPVIDIAMPALKQLSLSQYKSFRENLIAFIEMDSKVDLLEWSLQKILFSHLDAQFFKLAPVKARYSSPGEVKNEIGLVLSVIARAGTENQSEMEEAFDAAAQALGLSGLALLAKNQTKISDLDRALGELEQLKPLAKSRFLTACVAGIVRDQRVSALEVELLRAFASALDCPIPPAIP